MKVLVTGASGGLASALVPILKRRGNSVILSDLSVPEHSSENFVTLDISDESPVRKIFSDKTPELVFHLAAATDVDRCEIDPQWAAKVNTVGTENIALACRELDIPMIYVSTAEVFDGYKPTPYVEDDAPNPLNTYAQSKLKGEKAVQKHLSKYFIVRTAWIVSGGKSDKKFVGKILRLLETEKEIRAVNDKIGSPTFAKDLAKNMVELAESGCYGLYHMVNQGFCSRYEMAQEIFKILEIKDVKLTPVSSKAFPTPALRGPSEALENRKLGLLGLDHMPSWKSSLRDYLDSGESPVQPSKNATGA